MLPGPQQQRLPAWRLSIGRKTERGFPSKNDYFTVTRLDKQLKGYVIDERMQALLQEVTGQAKPETVPCVVATNDVDRAVQTGLAMYMGGRVICSCDSFAVKDELVAREQGLPWPPTEQDDKGGCEREYYQGIFSRNFYGKEGEGIALRGKASGVCDPATCPFAQKACNAAFGYMASIIGQQQVQKAIKNDVRLCKPRVIMPVILPWVQDQSPYAKFTASAWNTGRVLPTTLEDIKGAAGCLAGIPLKLRLNWKQMQTERGPVFNPVVTAEPGIVWAQLPVWAEGATRERLTAARQEAQLQAVLQGELLGLPEGRAFQAEFAPDTDATDAAIVDAHETRIRQKAEQANWSKGRVEAALQSCENAEEVRDLEDILDEEIATPIEPTDVDFDAPAGPNDGQTAPLQVGADGQVSFE